MEPQPANFAAIELVGQVRPHSSGAFVWLLPLLRSSDLLSPVSSVYTHPTPLPVPLLIRSSHGLPHTRETLI